jgi:hypothetical protein
MAPPLLQQVLMKRPTPADTHPRQERHPTVDMFERVMTSGVVVDRGPSEQHREMWFDVSVAGLDLLAVENDSLPRSTPPRTSSEE